MKTNRLLLSFIIISLLSCSEDPNVEPVNPLTINITGNEIDTAYLNTQYKNPGAFVTGEGIEMDCDHYAHVTGYVNTSVPGIYLLDYDYSDAKGHNAATVTRTVCVVKNNTDFLNGFYDVASTCTAIVSGSPNPTATTNTYTATISSSPTKNGFELNALKIGTEYLIPFATLNNGVIEGWFYHRNFVTSSSVLTGTLSPSRNTFTIESSVYLYAPPLRYICKNVFTMRKT